MRKTVGGYITVEASFVFPIVFFIIMGLLKFGFKIYNNAVDKSLEMYLEIRMEGIEKNYYSARTQSLDVKRIVNEKIIKQKDIKAEIEKQYLRENISEYRNDIVIDESKAVLDVDGKSTLKNSMVVRYIHIIRAHVGRLETYD